MKHQEGVMTLVALLALMARIGCGAADHSQVPAGSPSNGVDNGVGSCWDIDSDLWPKTWRTQ